MKLKAILLGLVLSVSPSLGQSNARTCRSRDQPNPIAALYPNAPTGTINGTFAIIPIPLKLARQIVPSRWKILTRPYRALLPNFDKDDYPLLIQAVHEHDIQVPAFNYRLPDFSKIAFSFPFIDLIGDGYTSFQWTPSQLMTADNTAAIQGAQGYGHKVYSASFDPPCDAYRNGPGRGDDTFKSGSETVKKPWELLTRAYAEVQFSPVSGRDKDKAPYPLSLFKNITNQPIFGDGKKCDQQLRFFNTSISSPPFSPRFVKGTVWANIPPMIPLISLFGHPTYYGIQVNTPFLEINDVVCSTLQGYSGIE